MGLCPECPILAGPNTLRAAGEVMAAEPVDDFLAGSSLDPSIAGPELIAEAEAELDDLQQLDLAQRCPGVLDGQCPFAAGILGYLEKQRQARK